MQEIIHNIVIINNQEQFNNDMKTSLIAGLNIIVQNNILIFKKEFYRQSKRAPMGSPVSGLLEEFELRPLGKYIFDTTDKKSTFWVHYVDDIFILWDYDCLALHNFLYIVNNLDFDIKFTLLIDKDSSFPFLDVHMHCNDQMLSCTVYRKPKRILLSLSILTCLFTIKMQHLTLSYNMLF